MHPTGAVAVNAVTIMLLDQPVMNHNLDKLLWPLSIVYPGKSSRPLLRPLPLRSPVMTASGGLRD